MKKISISGAGLVGSLLANYLIKRGYEVEVYERRNDPREANPERGRSINLALSNRGWRPLQEVGLEKEVAEMVIPMRGRMIHDIEGPINFQPYAKGGLSINSISRAGLNNLLITSAEKKGVKFIFNSICENVDINNTTLSLRINGQPVEKKSDIIIGADGAFSAIRGALEKTDRFNYSQFYLNHGYKELTIPPANDNGFLLEKHALHIWPRKKFMLIALPNLDGSFTVTLFLPFEGEDSFSKITNETKLFEFFENNFQDALPILPSLAEDFFKNPTGSLVTVRCFPWVKNKVALIGDAAHAIVPFYGQGMNAGFEDCRILNNLLNQYNDDWDTVLPLYQQQRKPDGDAISELAIKNFVEMRDHVSDKEFLLRKKIESKIHDLYPDKWIPLYSMVTFQDTMRYSEALSLGKKQEKIMLQLMKDPHLKYDWESRDYADVIRQLDSTEN